MEKNPTTDRDNRFKDKAWINYLILIWNGAILFFLIDLFLGFFIVMIVYALMTLIFWLAKPWIIVPEAYTGRAMALFSIIYLISLVIVACWRHFILIIRNAKRICSGGPDNHGQKPEQKSVE